MLFRLYTHSIVFAIFFILASTILPQSAQALPVARDGRISERSLKSTFQTASKFWKPPDSISHHLQSAKPKSGLGKVVYGLGNTGYGGTKMALGAAKIKHGLWRSGKEDIKCGFQQTKKGINQVTEGVKLCSIKSRPVRQPTNKFHGRVMDCHLMCKQEHRLFSTGYRKCITGCGWGN
ncbi:hypothetical protein AX15_001902 [Amanita polypyramis BW_CC]|nr:hypothetical protein AX15_001902 [Amanita polypyramis BW_CC]